MKDLSTILQLTLLKINTIGHFIWKSKQESLLKIYEWTEFPRNFVSQKWGRPFSEKKDGVTSTRLEDAIPRRRGTARRISSVRSVFRARIVFDFRPIKVDSAHRPVFRGADTPGGLLSAGWIRTFGSRDRAQYPVPDLSRGLRHVSLLRDSEKYYLSASWHINSPYAMIIKVSRDTVSGRRSICSGGAVIHTGCPAKGASYPHRGCESSLPSMYSFLISFINFSRDSKPFSLKSI